jgi:hypothetical protein
MPLRFNTLPVLPQIRNLYRKVLFFILLAFAWPTFAQTDDVKKQALKLFEEEEYDKAYKLYSQLVANYPKDPDYNYRLGVCMIYAEPDKKKCLPFLKQANSKPEEAPKETKFYLGKAYHINYLFDEAIKYYNEYKKIGSSSQQKKLQVDREIKACAYGKRLLSNLTDLVIQSKKTLNEADYFRSYDLKDIGGKLLVKPEDFKTSADKKKKDKSIVYLPGSGSRVYFSSYGESDNKDIYYATKLPNGTFSPPQKVTGINSEFDEDFPFLHPNGTTMYFASKGFNSMGGYDIFKSTYIESTNSWSQPVNLEFPINSPDDDYLYVTDSLEKTAYFSTGRQSLPGKIDVLKISTERKPIDVLALKGTVLKENADQSLKSKITVKNMDNGNIVGIFEAEDNGDYLMDLPNGANLLYTVETPGLKTQSERVGLPMVGTSKPLKQSISYDNGILKILNYFDETATDDSYLQYLKIIEKKAKLDVNQGQNNLNPTLVGVVPGDKKNYGTGNDNTGNNPTVTDNSGSQNTSTNTASTNKAGMDNKQLADLAKKEAEDLNKEANKLLQDSDDAKELAKTKQEEADKKLKDADEAIKNAELITNEEEKKSALGKASILKTEAENDKAIAIKIDNYSSALKEDANVKIKESELNKQYSDELTKAISTKDNSKATLDKLNNIQTQIESISGYKNKSDEIYNSIKSEADEKEKEVTKTEKTSEDIKTNIQEIKEAIASNEADLAKAKRKEKEAIQTKINELKTEQAEKEKQYENTVAEAKKQKEELDAINKTSDLVTKVKNETIATNTKTVSLSPSNTNTSTSLSPSEKVTNKSLADKYKDLIVISDNTNKNNIEQSSNELKNYNTELDAVIAKNKADLTKTTNPNTKQQLTNEIKLLEATKKQNQQKIAANSKKLDDLNKAALVSSKNEPLTPITSSDNNDAIGKLDNLNNKLNSNDKANFDYNGYQNAVAQKLKIEADAKINESEAQQKKLKDLIASAKDQLKNSANNSSPVSVQQLYKDAEDLNVKAFDLRTQANTKTGTEKDALLNEAKNLESQANEKSLQAAEINKKDNKAVFDTEIENLTTLIADNKASETDLTEAKKLSEEAALAYKQANAIREEANSQTNTSAKLGNLSNAEEKEAEAIAKQKQAVDLLKTSSPGLTLKKAVRSSDVTANSTSNNTNLETQLSGVNNGVNELLNTKVNAYEKLYEANKLELEALNNDLKNNQAVIDRTPAFKTDFISATNKMNAANNAQQAAINGNDNNKKLNDLAEITKKQIEALNQLNALAKKVNNAAAATARNNGNDITNISNNNANNGNNSTSNNNTAINNAANTNTVNSNNNDNSSANNPANNVTNTITVTTNNNNNPTANNNNATNSATTTNSSDNSNTAGNTGSATAVNTNTQSADNSNTNTVTATSATTVDIQTLASKDTSAAQIVNLFESKKVTLNNQQANALINKSITELKNIENESKALDNQAGNGNNVNAESPAQLKTKAENLLVEAEDLGVKAFDLRTQANSKTGTEKDELLAKSKELDDQSQAKKLEAVTLTEKSNQVSYNTNNTAIDELLLKLKTDDPDLASQLSEKNGEVNTLKNQSKQLREEANSQANTNAKIGSMMNAEEKESEMLQKQNDILNELKKRYPDYVVKENNGSNNTGSVPADLAQKKTQLAEKQNEQLTNLTNAFSLEYETSKNNVNANLNNDQKAVRKNADDLNAESKRLLIQSASEKDPNEKVKLLTLAAKSGNAAVELLNALPKSNKAVANNTNPQNNTATNPRNNTANSTNNNPRNNTSRNNTNNTANNNATANTNPRNNNVNAGNNNNTTASARTIKVEGLEVTAGNAYSAANPIPVDAKVPDGLVFRVQIGAFKSRLPDNSFRGLSPLNAETTSNGYIRYTAGNFNKLENANAVKNDLRNLGYSDAFVVVFYNGKRISLNEALDIMSKEGKTIDNNAPQTAGINANTNIPKATTIVTPNVNTQDAVTVTKELEQTNDLLYTVQIGVYNKQVNKGKLFNLRPIYTEKLPNGLYRYTAGIYNDVGKLLTDKGKVVNIGIKDAFVSAYFNGKRISFADGKVKQQDSTTKMEPENPIIFSDVITPANNIPANNVPANNVPANNAPNNTTVQPFSNGVSSYPAATAENGVKPTEEGICYKVQIGAYSKQVPKDVAAKFISIKTWPVENKQINGLFIYNIGNFSDAKFAKTLKADAVTAGITDAFITVYRDGKKLYGTEAAQYLNR